MKIFVRLKKSAGSSYAIHVAAGLLKKIPAQLKQSKFGFQYVIITDERVKKLYGNALLEAMRKEGLKTSLIAIPESETSKNWKTVSGICERLASMDVKRDGCILALGGGVVGDIAGFAASIFMRGIAFVQIPTTLLAMVDSSIGGKTGIDLEQGKNLVGTFYQPQAVFVDPDCLRTLPQKELRNGSAEMVKHGVIASRKMFLTMAKNAGGLFQNFPLLEKLVAENIRIKAKIVQLDEKESLKKTRGSRMLLNYGHTIGHAIEKLEQYKMPHGEAVSIGMVLENRIAVNKKMLTEKDALLIKSLLSKLGLSTKLPANISLKDIQRTVSGDKKNVAGKLLFALPTKIGAARIVSL